jgi:hypothetical protein
VVGAAVPDEVDAAVLGDDAMRERTRQTGVALAADLHGAGRAGRHGVVDHHAVHGTPRAGVVAVVLAPVADLDDDDTLSLEGAHEVGGGHGWGHQVTSRS